MKPETQKQYDDHIAFVQKYPRYAPARLEVLQERVRQGAIWMDGEKPGWAEDCRGKEIIVWSPRNSVERITKVMLLNEKQAISHGFKPEVAGYDDTVMETTLSERTWLSVFWQDEIDVRLK